MPPTENMFMNPYICSWLICWHTVLCTESFYTNHRSLAQHGWTI